MSVICEVVIQLQKLLGACISLLMTYREKLGKFSLRLLVWKTKTGLSFLFTVLNLRKILRIKAYQIASKFLSAVESEIGRRIRLATYYLREYPSSSGHIIRRRDEQLATKWEGLPWFPRRHSTDWGLQYIIRIVYRFLPLSLGLFLHYKICGRVRM